MKVSLIFVNVIFGITSCQVLRQLLKKSRQQTGVRYDLPHVDSFFRYLVVSLAVKKCPKTQRSSLLFNCRSGKRRDFYIHSDLI